MGRRPFLAVVAAAAVVLGLTGGTASAQLAEQIDSYDVAIVIEPTGALHIAEAIDYDFGANQRHGIFRDIPARLHYDNRYDRVYPLHVQSVTASPGTPANYKVESAGSGWPHRSDSASTLHRFRSGGTPGAASPARRRSRPG